MDSCDRVWTPVDAEARYCQALWTVLDVCGHGLEIYGSGGWGFESLRACCARPGRWAFLAAVAVPRSCG